jgi:hypothetical protein
MAGLAVELLNTLGVLETLVPRFRPAWMWIWSYPAPECTCQFCCS